MRFLSLSVAVVVSLSMLVAVRGTASRVEGQDAPVLARGVVFHDQNGNGQYDAGEPTLAGVRVSNGRDIVATNAAGRYELPVTEDTILFVIKPSGWQVPMSDHQIPQFYYIHKPAGSPESRYPGVAPTGPLPKSVDFALTPNDEPEEFKALLFGDPQPRNQQEVDWISHDVVEELIGSEASFGVTLGDIAFDNLETFEALNRSIALIGIPWYNVIGNHDINYDSPDRTHSNETYERVYGPSYYSFDYGKVHFLVVDDIEWRVDSATGKKGYRDGIGEDQLAFIKTDLAQIPADQMVVLMMHIPLTGVHDRHGLYRLIEQRPFCISISGHTHTHEHVWITKADGWEGPQPHHHIVNVTVCGSWWSGAPDERGIPHTTMADGGPNGYSTITFNGTDYRLDYKAAGRSPEYQMEIDAPEQVTVTTSGETVVYVNVFNGSEKSVVEMQVVGDPQGWVKLDHVLEVDPKFQRTYDLELSILEKNLDAWRKLPKPKPSTHLWKGTLPAGLAPGVHRIEVRELDQWQRTHTASRVVRVTVE
ncbi:MAG: calcineurin-like phosphoesterase family protein [Planctomycetaceae bacterium]|nr:calcineurin-like phosphoesterase family protein [Planctomycetaceae bacterium]